jgi:hypothetical protein
VSRTLIIGDLHGCVDELHEMLRLFAPSRGDRVVCVGDLVAKGPDSQGVLQLLREGGHRAVLGNHDEHVLRLRRNGPDPTRPPKREHLQVLESLTQQDWSYLEALPLGIELPEHGVRVVHAGMVPGVPFEQQEREHLLVLRSLTTEGRPSKRVEGGAPWASRWPGPTHVVFGHDAVRGLQRHPFATGLDTGCVYGRELTALVLPEWRFLSVKARRVYSEPRGFE